MGRLVRLHVRDYKRPITRYGFAEAGRKHLYAYTAYAVGAEIECWIKKIQHDPGGIQLTCNRMRYMPKDMPLSREQDEPMPGLPKNERMTRAQMKDREKAAAEKAPWDPYVAHVDEWLEDAQEPDPETDSWVAQ